MRTRDAGGHGMRARAADGHSHCARNAARNAGAGFAAGRRGCLTSSDSLFSFAPPFRSAYAIPEGGNPVGQPFLIRTGGERQNGRNWGAAEKGGAVGAKAGQKRPAAGTAPSGNGTNRNGPRATEGGGPSFGRHAQGIYRSATRCRGVLSGTTGESSSSSSSSMSVTSRPVSTPSV